MFWVAVLVVNLELKSIVHVQEEASFQADMVALQRKVAAANGIQAVQLALQVAL